jgi:hypothetical protein
VRHLIWFGRRCRPLLGPILLTAALVVGTVGLATVPAYAAAAPAVTLTPVAPLAPSAAGLDSGVGAPLAWCSPTQGCEVVDTYSANGTPELSVTDPSGTTAQVSLANVEATGAGFRLAAFGCASIGNCAIVGTIDLAPVPLDHVVNSVQTDLVVLSQSGGTWGQPTTVPISTTELPFDIELSNLSCPAAGDCAIAGVYFYATPPNGSYEAAFALDQSFGKFASAVTPLTLPGPPMVLNDTPPAAPVLSCTSPGACTLLGVQPEPGPTSNTYFDAFVASESSGGWSTASLLPSLEDDSLLKLAGLDCFSDGCWGVGTMGSASSSGPFVLSGVPSAQGMSWTLSMIGFSSSGDALESTATSLACASYSECVAMGLSAIASGSGGALDAFAVGEDSSGTFGSATLVTLQDSLPANAQEYVVGSCNATGACVVAGNTAGSPTMVASLTYTSSSGSISAASPVPLAIPSGVSGPVPTSVACAGSGCSLWGTYTTGSGATEAFTGSEASGDWSATTLALPSGATSLPSDASVITIACMSAGNCAALGFYVLPDGRSNLLPLTETNGSWSADTITIPSSLAGDSLGPQALACPSAGTCTGIGEWVAPSSPTSGPLAISETNGSWSATALPSPSNLASPFGNLALMRLSCSAPGDCSAIGTYMTTSGNAALIAYTEAGGTWSMQEPTPPSADASASYAATNGLVCFSAGDCIGVATFSSGTAVLTQSSGTWSVAPLPPLNSSFPSGASAPSIASLACPAAGACTAVGNYLVSAGIDHPLAYTESSGTWSVAPLPLPANAASSAGQSRLSSVACTTSGSCTAVGAYATQAGAAGDIEPMVLTESGGTWSATELPLPANAAVTNSQLAEPSSVQCPSAGYCLASGDYVLATGTTLIGAPVVWSEAAGTWSATELPLPSFALLPLGAQFFSSLAGTLSCPSATACAGAYSFFDGEDDLLGAIYSITSATSVPSAVLTQVVVPSTTTETYTATANGASITVSIPPGAFGTQTVELAVTQPTLDALVSALSGLGLSGDALVTGVGVEILDPETGLPITGSFAVPITVTIRSTAITSSSKVVEFPASGSPFIDANAEVTSGEATVVVSSDPTLAIANPSVVVPATHTGEPWAGSLAWWAMASLLAAGGVCALAEARRRPAHARHRSQDRLPRYGL